MANSSELKRLWRRYRESRGTKKQMSSQASSGSSNWLRSSSWDSKASMVLDEATAMIVGLGLDMKPAEEFIEYALDDDDDDDGGDPRFRKNPHGIGCSRTFEVPYSPPISPASMRPPVPQGNNVGPRYELLRAWKAKSIDFMTGKGKGRMPGDSADERYKVVLDGAASRAKSSAN